MLLVDIIWVKIALLLPPKRNMDVVEDSDEFEQESPFMVDLSSFLKDTLRSCDLQSAVPELCQQEECCMGIDEAGRGPVLG